jgi:hypothetical protein
MLNQRAHKQGRRLRVSLLTALGVLVIAAVAFAQSSPPITITVHPKVIPNKAGTPAHPQGVKIDVRIDIGVPLTYEPPLVDTVDVLFPRGGLYNGAKYPSCSEATLNQRGVAGCPRGAVMGHGTGVATADTTYTYPQITVVNGGASKVFFYTILNNPARVQAPVPGTITKLSGRWSYDLHVVIPKVLQVVAGIPIILHELHVTAGRGDWLATTYCPPNHLWAYHALTAFDDGQLIVTDGSVGCRR